MCCGDVVAVLVGGGWGFLSCWANRKLLFLEEKGLGVVVLVVRKFAVSAFFLKRCVFISLCLCLYIITISYLN